MLLLTSHDTICISTGFSIGYTMGSCPLISSLWSLYHYVGDLIARGYTARRLHIIDNVIISSSFTKSKCYQCIATVILLGRLFQQFCNVNHPIVRINCILDYVYGYIVAGRTLVFLCLVVSVPRIKVCLSSALSKPPEPPTRQWSEEVNV